MAKVVIRAGKILIGVIFFFVCFVMFLGLWSKAVSQNTTIQDPNSSSESDLVEIVSDSQYRVLLSENTEEDVSQRGPNRRVWQIKRRYGVTDTLAATADVEEEVSTIVEMGSGLCYPDETGSWQITEAAWQQTDEGFVMDRAGYQLKIGPTLDSWLEYTVDGITLLLRPDSILADDGTNLEVVSSRQTDIYGYIDPNDPARLVFENAFGENIDLELCTYPDRYHQNVVFHTAPQLSPMLNKEKVSYEIHTEMDMAEYVNDGMIDIAVGRDISAVTEQLQPTKPSKKPIRFRQRFIENDIEYEYDLHRFEDSKVFDKSLKHQAIAPKQLCRDDSGRTYLVESLGQDFFDKADYPVTWDYQTINGVWDPNDNIWYADKTYYISSDLTIDEGELWIEPGTFVKSSQNTTIKTSGSGKIIARGKPYKKIMFCGAGNSYNGETISGESVVSWKGLEVGQGSEFEYCFITHANLGITFTGKPSIPFRHNHITASNPAILIEEDAVDPNSGTFEIFNNVINGATGPGIKIKGGGGSIRIINNTIHRKEISIELTPTCDHDLEIKNNLFYQAGCWDGTNAAAVYNNSNSYDPNYPANPIDPNDSILDLDYNGYYDNSANTYNVVMGDHDVEVFTNPLFTDFSVVISNYFLNTDPNGGALLADAGDGQVTDPNSGYQVPNDWSIYSPPEDNAQGFVDATTITQDTIWSPDYSLCDVNEVAIGFHHRRVDYLIGCVDVTVQAALDIRPGTVICHDIDSTTGDGELIIDGGSLICKGEPFGSGYVTWAERGRSAEFNVFGVPFDNNKPFIECGSDSVFDIQFTNYIGMKTALFINNANGIITDSIFFMNTRGITFSDSDNYVCANCLFMGPRMGVRSGHIVGTPVSGTIRNCTFDRNYFGIFVTQGDAFIENCLFTNNSSGIRRQYNSSSCEYTEQYNAFYNNGTDILNYELSSSETVDSSSWAYPQEDYAQLLNGDPFDPNWTNFDDRFCLIADSNAVDNGYDPNDVGMYGYTTFIDETIDANDLDIGFHRPVNLDTDNDSLLDYEEYWAGSSPFLIDTDGDGYSDYMEVKVYGTDPADTDSDNDGLPDGWEIANNLDALDATGDNGANGDPEDDGFENYLEYRYNLDPWQDSRGVYETHYEYDSAGQVTLTRSIETTLDSEIYITESHTIYDVLGRQIVQRQLGVPGRGTGFGADDTKDRLTLTEYNIDGSVKKTAQKLVFSGYADDPNNLIIEPNDIVTENRYNSLGQLEKVINPEGYETSYTYTSGGKVKTVTDPNDNVTTNYYDGAGRLERVVNPLGHSRTMDYDSMGRVLRQIAWEDTNKTPTDPNDDTPLMQQWYAYDGMGHVIRQAVLADANSPASYIADPNTDKVTDFVYDDANDDYPGMLVEQKIYYAGNPCTAATTTYDYDLLGRRYQTTDPANNVTLLTYDIAGRVKLRTQTDDNPLQGGSDLVTKTEYDYDDFGRLESVIADPNGWTETQMTTYAYGLSWRVRETKPNGVINTTAYNTFGEKVAQVADADTSGIKQTTEWGYDRAGRQVTITGYCDDADTNDDQTTTYTYDKRGLVTQITYPDSNDIQYVYNSRGMVWKRTDQRDLMTYYVYDAGGNLMLKTNDPNDGGDSEFMSDPNVYDPNGVYFAETFTYDGLGRQLTADRVVDDNDISASVFAYNDIGMLTSEKQTLFGGTQREVTYGYDQFGYRISIGYPDGSTTITRTNEWNGQIDTLSQGQTEVQYQYLGSRTVRRSYNTTTAVDTDYGYDNLGRITSIDAGTSLVKFTYTYESDENNIDKKYFHHRGSTIYNNYDYDDLGRVTRADYLVNELTNVYETFNMDDLGNRAGNQTLRDDGMVNFAVDTETNRYTSVGGNSLDYDNAGNLTTDKDGYVYTYDYENRIIKIVDDQDNLIATFDYDTQGRRIKVYDAVATSTTYYYYSDNWQVLEEHNSTSFTAYYVFGNYIDEVLLMHRSSADKYYLHDHLYSPVALLNSAGSVVERYEYDAYGKATVWDYNFTNSYTSSQYGNPYLFTGREVDLFDTENLILQYNRHRYLSQYMGRWFTRDPLGYIDGMNSYEYVKSTSIVYKDPEGKTVTFSATEDRDKKKIKNTDGDKEPRGLTTSDWTHFRSYCVRTKGNCHLLKIDYRGTSHIEQLRASSKRWEQRAQQYKPWGDEEKRTNYIERQACYAHEKDHQNTHRAFASQLRTATDPFHMRSYLSRSTCEMARECVQRRSERARRRAFSHSKTFDNYEERLNSGGMYDEHPFDAKLDLSPCDVYF